MAGGRGACVGGACIAGGMHGRGTCMAGGVCGKGGVRNRREGTHPTGMHSSWYSVHKALIFDFAKCSQKWHKIETFLVSKKVGCGGSRIFLRRTPTPKVCVLTYFFAENCMKMKEFGPPWGRIPGASLL